MRVIKVKKERERQRETREVEGSFRKRIREYKNEI